MNDVARVYEALGAGNSLTGKVEHPTIALGRPGRMQRTTNVRELGDGGPPSDESDQALGEICARSGWSVEQAREEATFLLHSKVLSGKAYTPCADRTPPVRK